MSIRALIAFTTLTSLGVVASSHAQVNPRATPAAGALLARITALPPGTLLSGQHEYVHQYDSTYPYVYEITGAHPVIWGTDLSTYRGDPAARLTAMAHAVERHRQGAVVTVMWHAPRPHDTGAYSFRENVQGELTDAQWDSLVTPGTVYHARWLAQVDEAATALAVLRDADIPVLWRPYHEMNGAWFWWGARPGPEGYQRLYRLLYARLVDHHRLDNLIWVWNANGPRDIPGDAAGAYAPYYPGPDVVDVLATDVYHSDYEQRDYEELLALADGKPVALGEVGTLPSDAVLAAQPAWRWFMVWTTWIHDHNTPADVRRVYARPTTVDRARWREGAER